MRNTARLEFGVEDVAVSGQGGCFQEGLWQGALVVGKL